MKIPTKKDKFLLVGDVIKIEKGMKIYANIPECFVYSNRRASRKPTKHDICVGDVLDSDGKSQYDTSRFIGEYVITDTRIDGGGTGHGPHDIFPDGYHVTAVMLELDGSYNENRICIDFYQSGCFTAMILPNEIKPVRKMQRVVTFVRGI